MHYREAVGARCELLLGVLGVEVEGDLLVIQPRGSFGWAKAATTYRVGNTAAPAQRVFLKAFLAGFIREIIELKIHLGAQRGVEDCRRLGVEISLQRDVAVCQERAWVFPEDPVARCSAETDG